MSNQYSRREIIFEEVDRGFETPCKECISHKCKHDGYTKISLNGKVISLHRLEWEKVHGQIPEGMCILHRCDNPACCNVEHLFLGTQQDNIIDMNNKGRRKNGDVKGIRNPQHKLTEKEVLEIKNSKSLLREYAEFYNVSISTISDIRVGRRWKHL